MRFEKWQALGNDYLIVEAAALPWELTPRRGSGGSATRTSGSAPTASCCSRRVEDPAYVAELRIFNPDGSEAELSGNGAREAVLYLRRSGWTDADEFTILTKAGPITPTIRSDRECTLEMGRASTTSDDFPSGGEDGTGEVAAAGRTGRSSTSRSATRSARSRSARSSRRLDLARDRTGDREQRAFPEPHQRELLPRSTATGSARGSSSAGWGRRSPRGPAPAAPRWRRSSAGAPGELTVELDGGELEVEVGDELDVRLTGWAEPVYAGELSAELLAELEALG